LYFQDQAAHYSVIGLNVLIYQNCCNNIVVNVWTSCLF